jgi:serine/threonine-protein kinase RsbW
MEPLEVSLHLDLSLLRGMRRDLATWLGKVGVPDEIRDEVILATHEAAANAIEHADLDTEVTVRMLESDGKIIVHVLNRGQWRPPRSAEEMRGRGLSLIEQLMSDVDIQATRGCTMVRMLRELPQLASSSA